MIHKDNVIIARLNGSVGLVFRHNIELYNSIKTTQQVECSQLTDISECRIIAFYESIFGLRRSKLDPIKLMQ